jgi:sugar lactone lactonase YvrE
VLSPDGTSAALVVGLRNGGTTLRLADLVTGSDHEVDVHPAMAFGPTMVWSPDGRWLFVVDETGHLHAVDPRTRQVAALPGPLPLLRQLAVRTGR